MRTGCLNRPGQPPLLPQARASATICAENSEGVPFPHRGEGAARLGWHGACTRAVREGDGLTWRSMIRFSGSSATVAWSRWISPWTICLAWLTAVCHLPRTIRTAGCGGQTRMTLVMSRLRLGLQRAMRLPPAALTTPCAGLGSSAGGSQGSNRSGTRFTIHPSRLSPDDLGLTPR